MYVLCVYEHVWLSQQWLNSLNIITGYWSRGPIFNVQEVLLSAWARYFTQSTQLYVFIGALHYHGKKCQTGFVSLKHIVSWGLGEAMGAHTIIHKVCSVFCRALVPPQENLPASTQSTCVMCMYLSLAEYTWP